jgi:hypothetical protein
MSGQNNFFENFNFFEPFSIRPLSRSVEIVEQVDCGFNGSVVFSVEFGAEIACTFSVFKISATLSVESLCAFELVLV